MSEGKHIKVNKTELERLIEEKVEEKLADNKKRKSNGSKAVSKNISRREFLKTSVLGLGGLAVLSSPVSADYFVKDDSFSVQTSSDGGSTLTEGLFVDQNQNVNVPNGNLTEQGNSVATRKYALASQFVLGGM